MSSGGNSTAMAAYQHMPNSSGANHTSGMAASGGMHAIGNSPGMLYFMSFFVISDSSWHIDGTVWAFSSDVLVEASSCSVTFTNSLSVAEHIQSVINSCAQTLYALIILLSHGMDDAALQMIYRSVVIAKLTYASSAWWGFASTADRQRLEAFLRRSHCCRFIPRNLPSFSELCSTADNELFQLVINDNKHVLYGLLPPTSVASHNYNLRHRKHSLQLPSKTHHLMDSKFIQRMLYLDSY